MTVRARNRLVSFRLTGEELENLRIACLVQGARNVSEFARSAVLELSGPRTQPESQILDRFGAMEARIGDIESQVRQNSELLRALLKAMVTDREKAKGA